MKNFILVPCRPTLSRRAGRRAEPVETTSPPRGCRANANRQVAKQCIVDSVHGNFASRTTLRYRIGMEEFCMINTSRLLIRQFQSQDHISLFEYLSNPSIYRFEPGEPISLEQAKELTLERAQGNDFWAVILKSDQKMVRHLYFKQTEPKEFLTWELGYIFNPAFHNSGYAAESAYQLIYYGFKHFGIHRVTAHCNPENVASWRVLEKIGMRREGHFRKNVFFSNKYRWLSAMG